MLQAPTPSYMFFVPRNKVILRYADLTLFIQHSVHILIPSIRNVGSILLEYRFRRYSVSAFEYLRKHIGNAGVSAECHDCEKHHRQGKYCQYAYLKRSAAHDALLSPNWIVNRHVLPSFNIVACVGRRVKCQHAKPIRGASHVAASTNLNIQIRL
jgi:hypothetical protein